MRARDFIREAELPAKAMQVLWRLKHGLEQPGLQLQQPAQQIVAPAAELEPIVPAAPRQGSTDGIDKILDKSEMIRLQSQIQRLEKLAMLAQRIEQMKSRLERTRLGMDRGTAADVERLTSMPVPETDEEMAAELQRFEKALGILQMAIERKKVVWR